MIDLLLATLSGLEPCEHDKDVLAGNIRCAACASPAADPDPDCVMIAKLSDDLGKKPLVQSQYRPRYLSRSEVT